MYNEERRQQKGGKKGREKRAGKQKEGKQQEQEAKKGRKRVKAVHETSHNSNLAAQKSGVYGNTDGNRNH